MAGEFSWKWIFTSSLLFATWSSHFVTQRAHSSLVTGDDDAEHFPAAPPSPAELAYSLEDEWDDDVSLPPPPPAHEEDNEHTVGNRLGERLDGGRSGKAEEIDKAPAKETISNQQLLQSVVRLLSAHLSPPESQQQQQQSIDLSLLLPILSQAITQMGSPKFPPDSADGAKVATEARDVRSENSPPTPLETPSQTALERVTTAPTKQTKPDPPPRTNPMSGGDGEAFFSKITSPSTVQKQPPPLPPAKPKRAIDTSRNHQSALPSQSKHHHTSGPSQSETAGQPETRTETINVRTQALRLNEEHVVNGMMALPKNYAMLGVSHAPQINVKRKPSVREKELDAEEELGEGDEDGTHHPRKESPDTELTPEFTRSPYNLEMTVYSRGSLERKKSGTLKGAHSSTKSAADRKGQRKGERTVGFEIHHADGRVERRQDILESDCRWGTKERKSEPKFLERDTSTSEEISTAGEEAESTAAIQEELLSNVQLLARMGDPERTIQLLQHMLETLKSSLRRNNSPSTAVGGNESFPSELESESEPSTLSPVGVDGEGDGKERKTKASRKKEKNKEADNSGTFSVLQEMKTGLTDTLRRQKNKKQKEKRSPREEGEGGVLTFLRRKISTREASKPTVLRKGAEDDESDEEQAQKHEASWGSPETTDTFEASTLLVESLPASTSERSHAYCAEAAYTEEDRPSRRWNDGEPHVYFSLPDCPPEQEPRQILTSTSSSAVDDEHLDDSSEHARRSSHTTTVSGSSVDSGECREGCTVDGSADRKNEQTVSSKRAKGRFLQRLFHRRRKEVSQPLPTARPSLEETDILLDEED